jgi:hypothetical protein
MSQIIYGTDFPEPVQEQTVPKGKLRIVEQVTFEYEIEVDTLGGGVPTEEYVQDIEIERMSDRQELMATIKNAVKFHERKVVEIKVADHQCGMIHR